MARGEITGKKSGGVDDPNEPQPVPTLAMSIPQFCNAHNISEGMFYKMKKQNKGLTPREMKIGTRTLITFEAAADWRREREADSAKPQANPVASPGLPAPVQPAPAMKSRVKAKSAKPARSTQREGASA